MIYNCPLDAVEIWDEHNCVWSKSYEEARGLFVALGNRLKAVGHPDLIQIESIMFDVERGASSRQSTIIAGANTIDALLLTMKVGGDNQANVVNVIHSAGTHGVEGFAGSAIQLNFLREMILQSAEQSSGEKSYVRKILLIHAVNPVGMRYHRWVRELVVVILRVPLAESGRRISIQEVQREQCRSQPKRPLSRAVGRSSIE